MSASPTTLDIEVPGLDKLFIAGQWVSPATSATMDVVMPSTGQVLLSVPEPSAADADAAVAAAKAVRDSWAATPVAERVAACTRWADELEARMDLMTRAWMFESGYTKTHGDILNGFAGPLIWRHALSIAPDLPWEERRQRPGSDVLLQRLAVGTVLGILTYNGPVAEIGMKIMPAVLAGCPVVIKGAPDSQLTTRFIADAARAAGFPAGVVSVLAAGTETSQYLVRHPDVDMVHMTGGTPIAVEVVKNTADRLARTGLELGGKSAAIIAEDADLATVLPTLVPGIIAGNGQVCVALSRVLAPRSRYDEVVDGIAAAFTATKVGDPFDESSDLGSLGNERALVRTEKMLATALEQGARVAAGGKRPSGVPEGGFYFEPTLLRDVDETMDIAQEEVFGPIYCVIPFDDEDDAVRIANGTKYGLAASVYAGTDAKALEIAKRLYTGTVAINMAGCSLTEPFGGVRQSGWGRECGAEGILEFTSIKSVLMSGSFNET